MLITCKTQQYAWGKKGKQSEVARLKKGSDVSFQINEETAYAEYWMGTHPSAPSIVDSSGVFLLDWLKDKPEVIGNVPSGYPSNNLPFLFKVLSIGKALSIQAHPDKVLAEELFRNFPDIYKDSNHKPEMAIALTPFEAMCGFRVISEIKDNISNYPELKIVIGREVFELLSNIDDNSSEEVKKNFLKLLLKSFMDCSDEVANEQIELLISRLKLEASSSNNTIKKLILRLNSDFPCDRGIFCPLLLNYLQLNEGDGFFMGANEPHAYISGDCIECMAISDNVVRAGLTPKFRDVETLCRMLKYTSGKPSLLEPVKLDNYTTLYRPDKSICSEFEVEYSKLPSNVSAYSLQRMNCACLLLITQGIDGKIIINDENPIPLIFGNVYFLNANSSVSISTNENVEGLSFFRAHINLG